EFLRAPPLVERAVGAGDGVSLGLQDECQRQHPAPPDAAEEISRVARHGSKVKLRGVAQQGKRGRRGGRMFFGIVAPASRLDPGLAEKTVALARDLYPG